MLNNKKGLETKMLITIILLLIGFGFLLLFLTRISHSELSEREACKESVTLRALPSAILKETGSFVPLNCKTQKFCITAGFLGGDCKEDEKKGIDGNFEKSDRVVKVKVDNEKEIAKKIAEEVFICWDMLGQGRLSLFSQGWKARFGLTSDFVSSCVVCSRIAFDSKTLKDKGIQIDKVNVYDYMMKHKVPGKEFTYAEYIASGSPAGVAVKSFSEFSEKTKETIESQAGRGLLGEAQQFRQQAPSTENPEIAIVFMQFSAPKYQDVLINTLGVVGGAFVLPGVGKVAIWTVKVASKIPIINYIALIGLAAVSAKQAYNVYKGYEASVGYCSDISIEGRVDDNYGCSGVRVMPYDMDALKQFCGAIESIP